MTKTQKPNNNAPQNHKDWIYLRTKAGQEEKSLWDDILYLKADKDFTTIVTTKGSLFKTGRIGKIIEKLGHPTLFRCHKSFAININKIEAKKYDNIVINGKEILVAKKHRKFLFNEMHNGVRI